MLLKMFSLYDSKAAAFAAPFSTPRRELAQRAMVELMDAGQSQVARFPEDFLLFELGEFDDQTGVVVSVPPVNLGPVSQWKGNAHG